MAIAGAALDVGAADRGLESLPLAARSGPAAGTMFTRLAPAATGVTGVNQYDDPQMWTARYPELMNGALGTGMAVADYDNDGRPDIFAASKTGPSRLYRNLGGWKFEDVTARAGISEPGKPAAWTQGASFADVNNDGWLDLYVCRFGAPNLLFVNQRDGTFREEAAPRGLAIADSSGIGAFFDYDRDGWLDVYIQTNMLDVARAPNGQRDFLLHNRGDGTFEPVTERAGITGENLAHSATVWDFDADGWPDIYVANDFATPDKLYRNNRDGTFTDVIASVVPHLPYSSMGADFGDVNNDGLPDFLIADMAATSHEKDYRGMAYSRTLKTGVEEASPEPPQYSRNALYLNTGLGRCREVAQLAGLAATDWTWSVRFEDLDNDGRLDLHVTNGMVREYQNADLLDRMTLAENPTERVGIMRSSPPLRETNLAFRNRGDLRFEEIGHAWGLDENGVSFGAAFGDFDGDGDLDVIYANHDGPPTVLRNDSPDGHRLVVALRGTASNRFGVGATVRVESALGLQVRTLVLSRGYLSSSEPILHFGLGSDTEIRRITIEWPSGQVQAFEHLPVDRKLIITEPTGKPVAITSTSRAERPATLFSDISAAIGLDVVTEESLAMESQALIPFQFDRLGPALALGDLNGDGKSDVVLGGTGRQPARIYFRSDRFLPPISLPPSPVDDGPLLLLDGDDDGRLDLIQTKGGTGRSATSPQYRPVYYRNSGQGFTAEPDALPPLPISVGAAVAADYDRDGRVDVFLGSRLLPGKYPLPGRSALLRNTGGKFADVTDDVAPGLRELGLVRSALWSDVDGDGWPDLLLALEWGGIRYFHNDEGKAFSDRSVAAGFDAAGNGWWTSLATADFNGDGRPDYAAGNVGLNTPYQSPALLYVGSFRGDSSLQLIEAYREGGRLFPRRTRKELAALVPGLAQRFPRNDAYARATLPELLGAERLAASREYQATQLESGVFLSQPDGTYRFTAWPRLAQVAPVQGMAVADFDGDGHTDVALAQNSFAPNPGIGRFDDGLGQLLLGDGRGGFTAVEPRESGLVIPGDAKAAVVDDVDDDGRPDLIVSRNRASTMVWHNQGMPGRHPLHVLLTGRAGGGTIIGAKATVEYADGSAQSLETGAGGGYYSQAAPGGFFSWTDGNLPRRVVVTWSDGTRTERTFDSPPPPSLTIERSR